MKKSLKRVFSLLLCLLLCVGMFPAAGAEEVFTAEEPAEVFDQFEPEYTEEPAVAADLEEQEVPTEELAPTEAAEPVEADPEEAAEPEGTVDPADAAALMDFVTPVDVIEPAAADPAEAVEPTDVPEPEVPADPAEVIESSGPAVPADDAVPMERAEAAEITEPAAAVEEAEEIAEPTEGVEPAEAAESTDAVEPTDVTEVPDAAEPAELIEVEEDTEEPQPAEAVILEPEAETPAAAGNPEAEAQDGQEQAAGEAIAEEAEPAEPETEQLAVEQVKVVFKPVPQDAAIAVYAERSGERSLIQAEEDGSYLLVPGEYSYDVSAEGCLSVEGIPLLVVASKEPVEISLALTAVENSAVTEAMDPEADGEVPVDERVQVVFRLSPENAAVEVQVYTKDDKGGQQKVEPEADGSYLLAPGTYFYRCHDDTGAFADLEETELRIETATQNPLTVEVTLIPLLKVVFRSEETDDLLGLTVLDREGKVIEPTGDTGTYRLVPGAYSYRYHDETGTFKDIEETAFTLDAAQSEVSISLALESVWKHKTYINPLYVDIIDESDLIDVVLPTDGAASIKQHVAEAAMMGTVHTTVSSAAKEMRSNLVSRTTQFSIFYHASKSLSNAEENNLTDSIYATAVEHTGNPTEGDYIDFQLGGWNMSYSSSGTEYEFVYAFTYYTTAAQESEITSKVNSIISSLNLSGKSDYQKILAVYSYITSNVTYDYPHLNDNSYKLQFTAYAALMHNTAVCQGYAVAFYRLCLTAGIDARVLCCHAENHAWNIARLDGKYYEMDTTWDAGSNVGYYSYFLKGSSNWLAAHGNSLGYLGSGESMLCTEKYSVSTTDYNVNQETTPTITAQPSSVTVNDEGTVTFKVTASGGGLSYQWQVRTSSSGSWANSKASGYNTATCKPVVRYSNNGCQYRCIVRNSKGTAVSSTATLTIKKVTPIITAQPSPVNVTDEGTVTFTVAAKGGSLSYQWQVRTSSGSWANSNAAGAKTATCLPTVKYSNNGCQYRCKVSNSAGTTYSDAATLTIKKEAPKITTQPASASVSEGTAVKFRVAATGGSLNYQWQVYSTASGSWVNSGISSAKTAALSFTSNFSQNGMKYRCRVSNSAGTVYSSAATLTVKRVAPKITSHPSPVSVNDEGTVTFKTTASGYGLSYQWQVRTSSSGSWMNSKASGYNTAICKPSVKYSNNGCQYRCKVSNSAGTVYTNAATLTIKKVTPTITTQPASTSVNEGSTAKFVVAAKGGGLSYQWQGYNASTGKWADSGIASAKSATLSFKALLSQNGMKYRCRVSNSAGTVYSNTVTLSVKAASAVKITFKSVSTVSQYTEGGYLDYGPSLVANFQVANPNEFDSDSFFDRCQFELEVLENGQWQTALGYCSFRSYATCAGTGTYVAELPLDYYPQNSQFRAKYYVYSSSGSLLDSGSSSSVTYR